LVNNPTHDEDDTADRAGDGEVDGRKVVAELTALRREVSELVEELRVLRSHLVKRL